MANDYGPPDKPAFGTASRAGTFLANLLMAVLYFAAARLSLMLAAEHTNASPVWPAAGMALAAVLLLGYRIAPGILAGAFLTNFLILREISFSLPASFAGALATALGNTIEAIAGAWLIRRLNGDTDVFAHIRGAIVFVVFGAVLSAAVAATIGVTTLCVLAQDWTLFPTTWITWWSGDLNGILLVAPLLLAGVRWRPLAYGSNRLAELLLAFLLLGVVSAIVLSGDHPLRFLIMPILLWIVIRFDLFETVLAVAMVSGVSIYDTIYRMNLGSGASLTESLMLNQSFVGVIAVTALIFSVAISERKRSREGLQAEKAFTDTIIDSVPGAFYVLDRQGRLVRWNRFLEELNGLTAAELLGMDSLRNIHGNDRALISTKMAEAFERGESEAEGRICGPEGTRYFLFTGRRIDGPGGPYVVGTGIDITQRKSAELELEGYRKNLEAMVEERTAQLTRINTVLASEIEERKRMELGLVESEAKYRDLVESANSVILRWTQAGTITFINRYAKQFFGYAAEEIVGRNIVGTIVPRTETSGRDLSTLAKDIFANPEAYIQNENENITKDGQRVWVSWTNRPIANREGAFVEILSVGNDITGHKLAEDRLRHTLDELAVAKERAEAADRLKSAFLATMSHELRTPLNSIIGFTGILIRRYVGPLNDEQAKQLNMVRNSAKHLLSLINDVLDISKIEAGQMQVCLERFDLPALIEQTVNASRPAADKKGLLLSFAVAPEVATVVSDRRRVEQILLNLLSNAVKFTDKGSVSVDCRQGDGSITVSVIDTGIGISEENRGKLFKAFQQVDSGTARKYEGTGLGLYICRRLADLLGGEIWVESHSGSGSTFAFRLPDEKGTT